MAAMASIVANGRDKPKALLLPKTDNDGNIHNNHVKKKRKHSSELDSVSTACSVENRHRSSPSESWNITSFSSASSSPSKNTSTGLKTKLKKIKTEGKILIVFKAKCQFPVTVPVRTNEIPHLNDLRSCFVVLTDRSTRLLIKNIRF